MSKGSKRAPSFLPRGVFGTLAPLAAFILASGLGEPGIAHADCDKFVAPSSTKVTILADLDAEERRVATLTNEVAALERTIKLVGPRLFKLDTLEQPILLKAGVGGGGRSSTDARELEERLAKELAGVGIDVPPEDLAALTRAIGAGGAAGVALAMYICLMIAEASADSSGQADKKNEVTKDASSTDVLKRAAQLARSPQLDLGAVRAVFVAKIAKAGSVTIPIDQLQPPSKLSGAAASTYMLGVVRKSHQAFVATATQRVSAAKVEIASARCKIATLKQQLAKRS